MSRNEAESSVARAGATDDPAKAPGDLIRDTPYAFAFRLLEPVPDAPRRLLLLLHGVGGVETQLAALGARVADDTLVALPRGPRSIADDRFGWFRVGFTDAGPEIVEEEAEESRLKLVEFIAQLQHRHDIAPRDTTVAGFSQGGIMAASAALTSPESVAAFAVLCGRILPEIEPMLAPREALSRLRALIVHGCHDDKLPVDWAYRADAWLGRLDVPHALRLHDAGHEFTPAMADDFLAWFDQSPQR